MSSIRILIVEDGEYKSSRVMNFILDNFDNPKCDISKSYSSAIKALVTNEYDLAIVDMSLPTFDKSSGDDGGQFRTYGGLDIARQIKRRKINIDFLFLTQYESFDDNKDISDVDTMASSMYGNKYKGCIYYEHSGYEWKEKLAKVINFYG